MGKMNTGKIDYKKVENYWSDTLKKFPKEQLYLVGGNFDYLEDTILRHKCELRHFMRKTRLNRKSRILELASGSGRWTIDLAPLVKEITAVDISAVQIDVAKKEAKKRKITNVHFIVKNVKEYSPEGQFDIIYLSCLTQYMSDSDVKNLLRTLTSHLKPQGILISRDSLNTQKRTEKKDKYPVIYRTFNELNSYFEKSGYSIIYQKESYFDLFYYFFHWLRNKNKTAFKIISKPYYITFYYVEWLLLPIYNSLYWITKCVKYVLAGFKNLNGRNHKFLIYKLSYDKNGGK
jgi:ubiquinone/menaquinone biosynthesis C-methylase UbiE